MPDNPNFNIFEGAPPRFLEAVTAFAGVPELALPVKPELAGAATFYSVTPFTEAGKVFLPAFTDPSLLNPPLVRRPAQETALTLFHAPHHELFIFNPPHPQARAALAPLRASRSDLSLLAGYLEAGARAGGDPARVAASEFSAGRLHAAHYFYAAAAARNPASRARFSLNAVLAELGLLQEAYDALKGDADPEAALTMAVIYRKTGHYQAAADLLAGLPQGTTLAEKKETELAWLALEAGRDEEAERAFRRISDAAFEKAEALSGLGAAMSKAAFKARDKGKLAAAASALRSALLSPSPASARIYFQLGSLYFRSGDHAQAEACYRSSAAAAPTVQALANLALTLLKTGKHAEAAAVTLRVALTDPVSAGRLAGEFPKDLAARFFPPPPAAEAVPPPQAAPAAEPPPAFPAPAAPEPRPAPALEAASLAPAQPQQPPVISARTSPPEPAPAPEPEKAPPAPEVRIETLRDVINSPSSPTEAESRKDDFISRAFKLASDLEDELGRKVYFNADGLGEAEKKLRLTFIKAGANPQRRIDMVRECAAFLCYFLQERHKGRLVKLADFDPWGWPMIFEQANVKLTTYPVQRVWRLLWEENVPEPGWLAKYAGWITDRLRTPGQPQSGIAAVKGGIMSHPERLADTATEHRRMLVLASSLPETSGIELGRSGLYKLNDAIRNNFKPDIPPTTDGWKLLRCYGHLLAATLAKDFKAAWYNTDGEDGAWSMQTPWKTVVFPLGKIYKTAANRGDLLEYYDALLAQKTRMQGGPTGA